MIYHENRLLANHSHENRQTILVKYHTLFFFFENYEMSQNLSSAAVVG